MMSLAKQRGITPEAVVMDTGYSRLQKLKSINQSIRGHGWVWVAPLRKNRKVNKNISLEILEFPDVRITSTFTWIGLDNGIQVCG